jgi:hypothetical protein
MKELSKNNICLKCYREFKAIENVKMRHATSQVAFDTLLKGNKSSLIKDGYQERRGYGTLLNLAMGEHGPNDSILPSSIHHHQELIQHQHQFTSGSHLHNVLILQGLSYDGPTYEKEDQLPSIHVIRKGKFHSIFLMEDTLKVTKFFQKRFTAGFIFIPSRKTKGTNFHHRTILLDE